MTTTLSSAVASRVGVDVTADVDRSGWPAELQLLLGDEAAGIVDAIAQVSGGSVRRWAPVQVSFQVGSAATVQYRVAVVRPDGSERSETFVAATGDRLPAGADVLDDGTTRVGVWRWPADPGLPGLAAALDPSEVANLLRELGLDTGAGSVASRVRAYRPGRRAVVEATGGGGRLFVKVVRPKVVRSLHDTHRLLAAHLPVPDSLGWSETGVLVLPAIPGEGLRDALRSGRSALPPPAAVDTLLDRLPGDLAERPARAGLLDGVTRHARTIGAILPAAAGRLDDIRDALSSVAFVDHPIVPVHGDLYEAQLLVDGDRFSGLIDVDTAGAGLRVDDYANFCAHLSVLALMAERPTTIRRYGAALLAHAEQRHDRADLRARVATAVVGLATGSFRTLEHDWPANTLRRLDLALHWLGASSRR